MKPNLFNYATSELSQDAFFCWLFEWANPEYSHDKLHEISLNFINYILEATHFDTIKDVDSVNIERQEQITGKRRVDFYIIMYKDNVIKNIIVFEDKISTTQHDDQLNAYKDYMNKKFSGQNISYVYIKSDIVFENEKTFVENSGYFLLDLDRLSLLLEDITENEIYSEYVEFLHTRKEKYTSYMNKNIKDWEHDDWIGFVCHINYKIPDSYFGEHYRGDNSWWIQLSGRNDPQVDCRISLEIVQKKCAIKVSFNDKEIDIIEHQDRILYDINQFLKDYKIKAASPSRGKNVTMAYIENYLIENDGIIDLEKTEKRIKDIVDKFNDFYDNW
jgi:hypothetical protein